MADPAVALRGVTAVRGGRSIWTDATFSVPEGSFAAVVGANGSGKTTLAKVILGLVKPTTGDVEVLGAPARRGNGLIALVPQQRSLANATEIRCRDLVSASAHGHGRIGFSGRMAKAEQVDAALAATGAGEWADERLGSLSGGQQQRVSISAAMVGRPNLLILDEPLAGLDLAGQVELVELVHGINQRERVTVLFITHDLNPVLDHIDSAIYIADRRLRFAGADEIADPELLTRIYGTPVRVSRTTDGCVFARAE